MKTRFFFFLSPKLALEPSIWRRGVNLSFWLDQVVIDTDCGMVEVGRVVVNVRLWTLCLLGWRLDGNWWLKTCGEEIKILTSRAKLPNSAQPISRFIELLLRLLLWQRLDLSPSPKSSEKHLELVWHSATPILEAFAILDYFEHSRNPNGGGNSFTATPFSRTQRFLELCNCDY